MNDSFILPGISPAVFWTSVGAAILIQGVSKSGFAGGAGILSLPLMMLVMPATKVAATLLPLLILCDMNAIYLHWDNKRWKSVLELYIPSILGILMGAAIWWYLGRDGARALEPLLKRFVGVMAVLFAFYIIGKETAMTWVEHLRPGARVAWPAGIAAGFCSTIAHAAGPIVGLYLFAQNLGKSLFVGTVAWTFTLINLTKLPFYVAVGLIDGGVLRFDLWLVWLIPIGSFLGKWMHHRVSESVFNRVIFVLTLIAGLQLVFNVDVLQPLYRILLPGS